MPLHTSLYLMFFIIPSLQRNFGERIHKLDSSTWGIRVEHISRCGWKLGRHLIEKTINIASRVVRHARPQHNCILNSSVTFKLLFNFLIVFFFCPFTLKFHTYNFFSLLLLLLLTNWVFTNASTNKVLVDSTLGLSFNLYYLW